MFGEPEDIIDWACDDDGPLDSSSTGIDFTNGNTLCKSNKKLYLKALKLVLHLKEGQLIFTRGKTHYLWQDGTSHIWPLRSLLTCLDSFSIEVQCEEEANPIFLQKDGAFWVGYYYIYSTSIKVDRNNAKRLITGSEIIITL